ncbi:DUF7269 family protein [Halobacterium zhouii]|uniref:DUF7269 family protein n=1 Tax=Halobacterium zhouii TaxID=2902624 RepID=UPI001E5F3FB4|nr:hypothetical protein [Halobacterium zhouii]
MLRRVLLVFGLAFTALGVAVAASPSVAQFLGLPNVPMVVVTALAVVLGLSAQTARKRVEFRSAEDASVDAARLEGRFEPERPGTAIDTAFAARSNDDSDVDDARLRERLRVLAVRVLVDAEGCSEREAHRRLDDGSWTDDRLAASLFSDEVTPPAQGLVAEVAGFETLYEREIRHALDELKQMSGVDTGGE